MPRKGTVNNPTGKGGAKKGEVRNPSGRSRKRRDVESACQYMLEAEGEEVNQGAKLLWDIATTADKDSDRIKAIETLMAYAYGRPTQRREITGADGGPVTTVKAEELTDDEIAELIRNG